VSETWRRGGLYLAGAWNIVGGLTALADPARHFAQLYGTGLSLGDPLQAFFFRATWINVIAWGVGYILAARHRAARAPVLIAGGAGKLAYSAACVSLVVSGIGGAALLVSGALDALFAGFFAAVLWGRRAGPPPEGGPPGFLELRSGTGEG
jgi:hypothetical protein